MANDQSVLMDAILSMDAYNPHPPDSALISGVCV